MTCNKVAIRMQCDRCGYPSTESLLPDVGKNYPCDTGKNILLYASETGFDPRPEGEAKENLKKWFSEVIGTLSAEELTTLANLAEVSFSTTERWAAGKSHPGPNVMLGILIDLQEFEV